MRYFTIFIKVLIILSIFLQIIGCRERYYEEALSEHECAVEVHREIPQEILDWIDEWNKRVNEIIFDLEEQGYSFEEISERLYELGYEVEFMIEHNMP